LRRDEGVFFKCAKDEQFARFLSVKKIVEKEDGEALLTTLKRESFEISDD